MSLTRIGSSLALIAALGGCVTTTPQSTKASKVQVSIGERLDMCLPPTTPGQPSTTFSVRLDGILVFSDMQTGEQVGAACGVGISKRDSNGLSKAGMMAIPMGKATEVTIGENTPDKEIVLSCGEEGFFVDPTRTGATAMSCPGIPAEPILPRPGIPGPSPVPAQRHQDSSRGTNDRI